jgi:hypothetical protein
MIDFTHPTRRAPHQTVADRDAGSVRWRGRRPARIGATNGSTVISSPRTVAIADTDPGSTVDIEVELVAPAIPGATIAFWQMVDQEGEPWYPDCYADCIWVRINVVSPD